MKSSYMQFPTNNSVCRHNSHIAKKLLHRFVSVFVLLLCTCRLVHAQVPPGNALNFDGVDDWATMSNSGPAFTNVLSLELWVRLNQQSGDHGLIGRFSGGSGLQYSVGAYGTGRGAGQSGKVEFGIRTGSTDHYIASTSRIDDSRWHHIACTYDGAVGKLYIDGVLEASSAASGNIATGSTVNVRVGGNYIPCCFSPASGSLDEIRFWNTALTQAQIQANMYDTISPLSAGLAAYYRFDQGTAGGNNTGVTTVPDLTGNGYDLGLNNMALTGNTSNWVESYAMVVPVNLNTSNVTTFGFTAAWTAPTIGTVTNYLLDVSSSNSFSSFVSGYNGLVVTGTSQAVTGLNYNTTYYYRVRADKTSVTGQGGNIPAAAVTTFNVPLSLQLLSFTGQINNRVAQLDWKTALEISVKQFIVERSADGCSFVAAGTVAAKGGNGLYHFDDVTSGEGRFYYRLKILETDGTSAYSNVISIKGSVVPEAVTIYPNPANETVYLKFKGISPNNLIAKMVDFTGKVLLSREISVLNSNSTPYVIDLSGVPNGIYLLTVENNGIFETAKLVIAK